MKPIRCEQCKQPLKSPMQLHTLLHCKYYHYYKLMIKHDYLKEEEI